MIILKKNTSPNYSRRTLPIDTIIVHHTEGAMPGCLNWLCDPASKVSAHYLITQNGLIYQLVDDSRKAWHAGVSSHDYNRNNIVTADEYTINARSVGIELESERGEYTVKQLNVLQTLVLSLMWKHKIKVQNVLGHKEVSPGRKTDPALDMDKFREGLTNA